MKYQDCTYSFFLKKILFLVIPLFFNYNYSFGQKRSKSNLKHLLKIEANVMNYQGLGFAYELPINKKNSLDFSVGVGGGYGLTGRSLIYRLGSDSFSYYFQAQGRHYYNRRKRIAKKRFIQNNSGTYIGLSARYTTRNIRYWENIGRRHPNNAMQFSGFWGYQQVLGRRFLFDGAIGATLLSDIETKVNRLGPAIKFRCSFMLSNKKGRLFTFEHQ